MRGALGGTFERAGANEPRSFRINQLLMKSLGRESDPVGNVGEFESSKKVEQGSHGPWPSCVGDHTVFVFVEAKHSFAAPSQRSRIASP